MMAQFLTRIRDGEFNPILVKEMRQAVRNDALITLLILNLLVVFVAMVVILSEVSSSFSGAAMGLIPVVYVGGVVFASAYACSISAICPVGPFPPVRESRDKGKDPYIF